MKIVFLSIAMLVLAGCSTEKLYCGDMTAEECDHLKAQLHPPMAAVFHP